MVQPFRLIKLRRWAAAGIFCRRDSWWRRSAQADPTNDAVHLAGLRPVRLNALNDVHRIGSTRDTVGLLSNGWRRSQGGLDARHRSTTDTR